MNIVANLDEGAIPVLVWLVHVRLRVLHQLLDHLKWVEKFSFSVIYLGIVSCQRTFPDGYMFPKCKVIPRGNVHVVF